MVKKKGNSMLGTGLGLISGTAMVGSIPNISGNVAETTIKQKSIEGFGKVGSVLPTMGKVKGASMVLDVTKKLSKQSKKFSRGGRI